MSEIIIATSDTLDGYRISSYLGLIASREFMLDSCLSNERHIDGFHSALKSAETRLRESAASAGANAVIGVRSEYFKNCGGTIVVLTGTAVSIEKL